MLNDLYDRVSPAMPADLVGTPVANAIHGDAMAVVETFNYDEGHAGRYAVPGADGEGGSISSGYVHGQADALEYVREHLLYRAPFDQSRDGDGGPQGLCFISPGLNTPLQPGVRDIPAPKRTRFYVAVLQCVSMAQLHLGSSLDQPEVCVVTKGPFRVHVLLRQLRKIFDRFSGDDDDDGGEEGSEDGHSHHHELKDYIDNVYDASTKSDASHDQDVAHSGNLLSTEGDTTDVAGFVPTVRSDGNIVFSSRLIDVIQAGLSEYNFVDTPLKQAYRFLLSQPEPLTLIAYSRSSMEVKAAIKKFISAQRNTDTCRERLLANVTVVTIGAACRFFPDGPAYLHVSSSNDKLVALRGVSSARPRGAGANSVFLHCKTPFAKNAADHHNMAVAAAPLLAIALAHNGVASLRALWQLGMKGELKLPGNVDSLVCALIVLTDGMQMMFNKEKALHGIPPDRLPNLHDARSLLQNALGSDFVERAMVCKARFDEWCRQTGA